MHLASSCFFYLICRLYASCIVSCVALQVRRSRTCVLRVYTVQTELNGVSLAGSTCVCPCVRREIYQMHCEQTAGPRSTNCWARGQSNFVSQFSSKSSTSLTFIFKVKNFNRVHCIFHVIISKTVTDRRNIAIENTWNRTWSSDLYIYVRHCPVLKVKVKVMHIVAVKISQIVTDRSNITTADT